MAILMAAGSPADTQGYPHSPAVERVMTSFFCKSAVAVSALLSLSPTAGFAQSADPQPPQVFRASADVVTIQASVRDRRGRVLGGLTLADFEIRDDGERRQVLS